MHVDVEIKSYRHVDMEKNMPTTALVETTPFGGGGLNLVINFHRIADNISSYWNKGALNHFVFKFGPYYSTSGLFMVYEAFFKNNEAWLTYPNNLQQK